MQIFKDLATLGSLEAVARNHHISEQSVLDQIDLFENECGAKLFDFDAGVAALTIDGKAQQRIVSTILAANGALM
jgi:DNA-binding transcriptional LysR family regulator